MRVPVSSMNTHEETTQGAIGRCHGTSVSYWKAGQQMGNRTVKFGRKALWFGAFFFSKAMATVGPYTWTEV